MKCYSYSEQPLEFKMIFGLFKAAFDGRDLDEGYWTWRFLNNPESDKTYINYIIEDGKLVAYYAVSPCKINIGGKLERIALSNMTMTHPDYTGKGYFKLLANNLYEELKNDGFVGVFGFANQNSHYGFKKNLGWKDLSALNLFSVNKKDFKYYPPVSSLNFKTEEVSDDDILEIGKANYSDAYLKLGRGEVWLNWRLITNPKNKYYSLKIYRGTELVAIIIYKKYLSSIDFMEVFFIGEIDRFEILNSGINYFLEHKSEQINCWTNLHFEEYGMLEKMRFKQGEFITYLGVIPFVNEEKLTDVRNWHYRFLDSDVF